MALGAHLEHKHLCVLVSRKELCPGGPVDSWLCFMPFGLKKKVQLFQLSFWTQVMLITIIYTQPDF